MSTSSGPPAGCPAFSIVLAAAGPSVRMGQADRPEAAPQGGRPGLPGWPLLPFKHVRKPYLPLDGVPMLLHCLARLRLARGFAGTVLAVHPEDRNIVAEHWGERLRTGFGVVAIVAGGARRQESVLAALEATAPQPPLVLIHDAARPLVDVSVIEAVAARTAEMGAAIAAAPAVATVKEVGPDALVRRTLPRECGAAIAAAPAVATIKEVAPGGLISATPPRERLWMAQTPQGFRRDLILQAHRHARDEGFVGTDDALLVERLGHPVAVVQDSRENLKITTPADLLAAEAILRGQRTRGLPGCDVSSSVP